METQTTVNKDEEDEFYIEGYQTNTLRLITFYLFGIISGGFLFLLGYWMPVRRTKFTHVITKLSNATVLVVTQGTKKVKETFICNVITKKMPIASSDLDDKELTDFELDIVRSGKLRYFEHMFLKYYFVDNDGNDIIREISGIDHHINKKKLNIVKRGLKMQSSAAKLAIHGKNIAEIPVHSFLFILLEFAANPFYLFQLFSVTLWMIDDYLYFSLAIIFMTLFSLIITTYETRKHLLKVRSMIGKPILVDVLQTNDEGTSCVTKSSGDIVPGDVFRIPSEGLELPCDCILIEGNCVVNESSLTGESFHVSKTCFNEEEDIENEDHLSLEDLKHHTLFHGTKVLQAHSLNENSYVKAMVIRTSFSTLKGRLIRSIVYPKPIHFKFFRDSMKFILFLASIGVVGIVYSMTLFVLNGSPPFDVFKRSLDVITIIVPPVLPACMSIGLLFAIRRLKHKNIFCTDPQRVNLCGKLKLIVFDKTGTLTNDELSVAGIIPVQNGELQEITSDRDQLKRTPIEKALACCHSLNLMNGTHTGNPLDCYMFEFINWRLVKKNNSSENFLCVEKDDEFIDVMKQFPFSSSLQRMSVVVNEKDNEVSTIYTKGAAEAILSFCLPDSLPSNVNQILNLYVKLGYRVLAVAFKELDKRFTFNDCKHLSRNEAESKLTFLGVIVFENQVKTGTRETINILQEGNIRVLMATGDNLYTGATVARGVNIILPHQATIELVVEDKRIIGKEMKSAECLSVKTPDNDSYRAYQSTERIFIKTHKKFQDNLNYSCILTGKTYEEIKNNHPNLLKNVLMSASVYARMSPAQKSLLVEDLIALGYGVGMCGDGANDCGALKTAHAGIALSDSEASIAAPFTSKVFDISCVPWLIREGREALVTSFNIFKFLATYSFIQFFGVLILYSIESGYSDWQFFYSDVVMCLPFMLNVINSAAVEKLSERRPPGRLANPIILVSFSSQILIILSFQLIVFFLPRYMPWYKSVSEFDSINKGRKLNYTCYENYSLMIVSFFQYLSATIICTNGKPYQTPLYKNYWFVVFFTVISFFTAYIAFIPVDVIRKEIFLFPKIPSLIYALVLILLALMNFYIMYVTQTYLLSTTTFKVLCNKLRRKKVPKNPYKHAYNALLLNNTWFSYETENDRLADH